MDCTNTNGGTAGVAIFRTFCAIIPERSIPIKTTTGARRSKKGDYVTGLITSVQPTFAWVKLGAYRALLTPADFSWTGRKSATDLLKAGDLVVVKIKELTGTAAQVELEQTPSAQAGADRHR